MAGNANSGNRTGLPRQRDTAFTDALRLAINRASGDRRRLDNVASALVAKAESGDVQAIMAIADRLEGKPLQQTENLNINEHVFAEVPETMSRKQWDSLTGAASGAPKQDRKQH